MVDYYQVNSRQYFTKTSAIDPTCFLGPLLPHLPAGAAILDVGCGSGRDLLWFKDKGFQATGFERSTTLAELARHYSGCPVIEGDFVLFDFSFFKVDAVLLVGALVHVDHRALAGILARIARALKQPGHILLSLKEGEGTGHHDDGRVFSLWSDRQLRQLFLEQGFAVVDASRQISAMTNHEVWLAYVLRQPAGRA